MNTGDLVRQAGDDWYNDPDDSELGLVVRISEADIEILWANGFQTEYQLGEHRRQVLISRDLELLSECP